jgi:hypothetical protein
MDNAKLLYGFANWVVGDTKHSLDVNSMFTGQTAKDKPAFYKALNRFADANGLSEPDDCEGVELPDYDY